jgi:hypothetical protein
MSQFIVNLKIECGVIRLGVGLFETYLPEIKAEQRLAIEELRLALYSMQMIFIRDHLPKIENILYPALPNRNRETFDVEAAKIDKGRTSLLQLRASIDKYNYDPQTLSAVEWRLSTFIDQIHWHLDFVDKLVKLAEQVLSADEKTDLIEKQKKICASKTCDAAKDPLFILKKLRKSKGLPAA